MESGSKEGKTPELLRLGEKITVLPIVYGSGEFSKIVVEWLLAHKHDCLAVPLPPSFRDPVESAILQLPTPSVVVQHRTDPHDYPNQEWQTTFSEEPTQVGAKTASYVPIDPCQGVISAIRLCMGEHIPRRFIDLESEKFEPFALSVPDPYAVREVAIEKFAAALLPAIPRPESDQTRCRMVTMAARLRDLERTYENILFVTNILHWPWIREAYYATGGQNASASDVQTELTEHLSTETISVNARTYMFMLGELPFITSLYERARSELSPSDNATIDGVKELLLAARSTYRSDLGNRARRITSTHLTKCLQYVRNLSLIHRRLTPDLVTVITACQQILGDEFALHVAEMANHYGYDKDPTNSESNPRALTFGINQATFPDGSIVQMQSRLPNQPVIWKTLRLNRKAEKQEKTNWQYNWNPHAQCSYPPEDRRIENFRGRVFERAKALIGNDLARTEKFTTSVKDGIDIRDTLRHWHDKEIYVKVNPPNRGNLDTCVMLFDSPADPKEYRWRTTWFAEHNEESTLAFFATHFADEMIGPGIGVGTYGGALFLYPPIPIRDIWLDPKLDYATTLEERLIAAACLHSRGREIAIVSTSPPGLGWKRLAKSRRKTLVHVPLSSFGDEVVQNLRRVHVLNGKEVRSYAEEFIRKP